MWKPPMFETESSSLLPTPTRSTAGARIAPAHTRRQAVPLPMAMELIEEGIFTAEELLARGRGGAPSPNPSDDGLSSEETPLP